MIRLTAAVLACVALGAGAAPEADDPALVRARALLSETILVDGHNDLPWRIHVDEKRPDDVDAYDLRGTVPGQTDLKRLREGRLGAQFWSVYTPGEAKDGRARAQLEQIELARRMIARYPEALRFATTAAEIRAAHRDGRIGSMLGVEGGHAIENSLGALRAYFDLGVRYMTLTHNTTIDWADAATGEQRHGGLTAFGEEVVREMNRLGMLVDLAHVSEATMDDALRVSAAPVIVSHSAARALVDHPRNVPDAILKRLPANGGVVMVAFVTLFVDPEVKRIQWPAYQEWLRRSKDVHTDAERSALNKSIFGPLQVPPTAIARVADHIEHIRKVAGVRHIGIGADYDGNDGWPVGLEDVSGYPRLFAELIRRGWSDADLKLLAGENVLRVMEQAEAVAARLQKTTPASIRRIEAPASKP
jgi:membrane dipeptidase